MKLSTAINKLTKAGFEISGNLGSYIATKDDYHTIRFFENGLGTNETGRFTKSSKCSPNPTYGLSLKKAMEFCGC